MKSFKDFFYWYHGTPYKNIESIRQQGLKPSPYCPICFGKKGHSKPGTQLRVHKKHVMRELLTNPGFRTVNRIIPPKHIQIRNQEGKWEPLISKEKK